MSPVLADAGGLIAHLAEAASRDCKSNPNLSCPSLGDGSLELEMDLGLQHTQEGEERSAVSTENDLEFENDEVNTFRAVSTL